MSVAWSASPQAQSTSSRCGDTPVPGRAAARGFPLTPGSGDGPLAAGDWFGAAQLRGLPPEPGPLDVGDVARRWVIHGREPHIGAHIGVSEFLE